MRILLCVLLSACGRQVWQASDPNTRADALASRVDSAIAGGTGVFSVRTPNGQWVYEVGMTRDARVSVAQAKAAYVSTLLLQLIDQGKAQLDDPLSHYVAQAPETTLRALMHHPEEVATMQEIVRVVSGDTWDVVAQRQIFSELRLTSTSVVDDRIETSIDDLISFGHALGEGSLLTASLNGERFAFTPLEGNDGYGLGLGIIDGLVGHLGDGCAVFHDPVSDVTIAMLYTGPLDAGALAAQLFRELRYP